MPKFRGFIQTVLANLYPKFGPCLHQTQFLSKFRIRPSKTAFFAFSSQSIFIWARPRLNQLECFESESQPISFVYWKPWTNGIGYLPSQLSFESLQKLKVLSRYFNFSSPPSPDDAAVPVLQVRNESKILKQKIWGNGCDINVKSMTSGRERKWLLLRVY